MLKIRGEHMFISHLHAYLSCTGLLPPGANPIAVKILIIIIIIIFSGCQNCWNTVEVDKLQHKLCGNT